MKTPFAFLSPPCLLDSCPQTFAAYSLRKLSSKAQYTIRVRRSSDNTTKDIGFVGTNLDTASLLTFCGVGNGFVSIWYDQSGNGYHQIQNTTANQPQIVSSGAVLVGNNNRPKVNWSGSHTLTTASTVTVGGGASTFWVSQCSWTSSSYCSIISCGYAQNAGFAVIGQTGGGAFDWTAGQTMTVGNGFNTASAPKIMANFGSLVANSWHLFDSTLGALGNGVWKDGGLMTATSFVASIPSKTSNLSIGNDPGFSDNFVGDISEIINFSVQLPSQTQNYIRNNVNKYYNLY